MSANAFSPQGNTTKIAVTSTASTGVQAPSDPQGQSGAMVYNAGQYDCFLAWGTDATVAAVIPTGSGANAKNGQPIPAGAIMALTFPPNAYFSAICASAQTATLYITRGEGN
jgi:hypothetical protein